MRKNIPFVISYLTSMKIGATINWAKNFSNCLFFGVNDIFNCALEGPFSSLMRAIYEECWID